MSPTLVISPGSFAPAALYTEFVAVLKKHGIESVVVSSPSVGRHEGKPPASMMDDADEIVRVVGELLNAGKEVVLLAHSYGGIPAAQSMERLSIKQRTAAGKKDGVAKMIYLTAIALPVGASSMDSFNPKDAPHLMKTDGEYMEVVPQGVVDTTFSDLPPEEGLEWAKKMPCHSVKSFEEKLKYPGYNDVEMHYILCELDALIPPVAQETMVSMIKESSGKEVKVHRLPAGHVPTVSAPEKLAELLKTIV
ncbi:hypothetical protein MCOR25_007668 [Pyricularia grisea]|uniref:AB hydrolase-1 domain-containing protein n=1 Tax=Pyricularia grisea TaxID=148305 RepID=A0A6P8AMH5_PYRGI|nr:uncharacterized protein PgNI_12500 [Pyricularia grisea]KAI6357365.1 hypothetical protein MCOR25_007668 [Pyricularia grisea]TLD03219.1 hypothetical protein PgNI_12500 [Pyricularia grisea]